MHIVALAARNAIRNPLRATLTMLAVAITVVAFLVLQTVAGTWGMAGEIAAKDRVATRHKLSFAIALPRHYVDEIRALPGVESATWASWFGGKAARAPSTFFASFAVDPASFLQVYDEIAISDAEKERWLGDRQGVIVGEQLARNLGLKVGDRLTMTGTRFPGDWPVRVSAVFALSRKSFDPGALLMHWDYVEQAQPEPLRGTVGWITSRVRTAGQAPAVARTIDETFAGHGHRTRTLSERDLNLSFAARFSSLMRAVHVMSGVLLLILALILANTIAMGVRERTHEYGVLRTLGFRTRHLCGLILGEAAILALAAGAVGVALGSLLINGWLSRIVEDNAGGMFPIFRLPGATAAWAVIIALFLGLFASLLPALAAARMRTVDALRNVE